MKARRIRTFVCILLVASGALGCGGGTLFIDTSPNGTNVIAVSGTCIDVHIISIVGSDRQLTTITVVTLLNDGRSSSFNFCGNIVNSFTLNTFVSVSFTTGSTCATPTSIVIT